MKTAGVPGLCLKVFQRARPLLTEAAVQLLRGWNANPITIRSHRVFELKSSLNLCRFPFFFLSLFRVNLVVLVGMKEVHQCENKTSPQQQKGAGMLQ